MENVLGMKGHAYDIALLQCTLQLNTLVLWLIFFLLLELMTFVTPFP